MFDSIPYPIHEFSISALPDTLIVASSTVLEKQPISDAVEASGIFFVIFTLFFLFSAWIIGKKWKMIQAMIDGLWRSKGRQSIFYTATENEQYGKYILFIQSFALLSIFLFKADIFKNLAGTLSLPKTLLIIGGLFLLLCLLYILKWVFYTFVGLVFFSQERLSQWRSCLFSMVCLSGLILFIPTLFIVFIEPLFWYSYYFMLIYSVLFGAMVIYKTFELFFAKKDMFLYLFLYLCAQEIIPLFFFYKSVVYLLSNFL